MHLYRLFYYRIIDNFEHQLCYIKININLNIVDIIRNSFSNNYFIDMIIKLINNT